jgi:hypothetical protein
MRLPKSQALWLRDVLTDARLAKERSGAYPSWRDMREAFPGTAADAALFLQQPSWRKVRGAGLLLV